MGSCIAVYLRNYNAQVLHPLDGLAEWVDLRCVLELDATAACIRSDTVITGRNIDELLILQSVARSRLYHLRLAQQQVLEMEKRIDGLTAAH